LPVTEEDDATEGTAITGIEDMIVWCHHCHATRAFHDCPWWANVVGKE